MSISISFKKISTKLIALKGPGLFTFVTGIGPVIAIFTGAIVAKLISPKEMGEIQTATLFLPYLTFLHLGVYNGLNREYPYLIGKGEDRRAIELVSASWTMTKIVTVLTLAISLVYGIVVSLFSTDKLFIYSVWFAIPLAIFYPITTHFETIYRTGHDFFNFGKIIGLGYIFSLVSIILVFLFGFIGQNIRLMVISLVNVFLRIFYSPIKRMRNGNREDIKQLIKIGLPYLVAGYLFTIFGIIDKSLIALRLGNERVGYYTLSTIVIGSMLAITSAINQVLYPKCSAIFGQTDNKNTLRKYIWLSIVIQFLIVTPIVVIGWILLPIIITKFLPMYKPGIFAAQLGLLIGMANIQGPIVVLNVIRQNVIYIFGLLVAIVLFIASCLFGFANGGNIASVVIIRIIITFFLNISLLIYSMIVTRDEGKKSTNPC